MFLFPKSIVYFFKNGYFMNLGSSVSSIYIWSENLVAESEAKDGGN